MTATEVREDLQRANALYDSQLEGFRRALAQDMEAACARYGFALFHSLPLEDQYLYRDALGLLPRGAEEFYNLGVAFAQRNDMEKAINCWNQALKADAGLVEACFNLALACEKQGDMAAAKANYKRYIESIQDAEEISRIRQHLDEMAR